MIRRAFPYVVGTAVVAAIAAGLVLIGSPSAERMRRLDEIRVSDLMQLSRAVDFYWKREGALPPSLDTLDHRSRRAVSIDNGSVHDAAVSVPGD